MSASSRRQSSRRQRPGDSQPPTRRTDPGAAGSGAAGQPAAGVPEAMAHRGSLGRFLVGFVYAGRGLLYALRTQRNARVHAVAAVLAIALGIVLRISAVEFAVIFIAITSVFVAEMFNTVVEACVDLATQEYHPLARIAKDVAAGAVLLDAILAVVVALFVYVPHLWPLFVRWIGH